VAEGVAPTAILLKPGDGAASGNGIEFGITRERASTYFSGEGPRRVVVSLEEMIDVARNDAAEGAPLLSPVLH